MAIRRVALAALLSLAVFYSSVFAGSIIDPVAVGVGARPIALGRAYVGLADDASAVFLNPAGLSSAKNFDFVSMKASLINEVGYTVLAAAMPLEIGRVGAAIVNSSVQGIPLTRWTDVSGVLRPDTYGYTDYGSNVFMLSYGGSLGEIFKNPRLKNISFGTSLKYYLQSFSETSASLEGASGSGADLDLGLKFKAARWLDMGLVLSNILPTNMGGGFFWKRNGVAENIPAGLKIGSAVKIIGKDAITVSSTSELVFLLDLEKNMDSASDLLLFHSGIEWKPVKQLALRIGLDQQPSAQVAGVGVETNLTYGVGINFAPVSFDYAYHGYGSLAENTTHYFSIKYAM
ncbi:MAG: hypothetical protein WC527_00890 [Candidatus Margulisiibacteriota bacterium]